MKNFTDDEKNILIEHSRFLLNKGYILQDMNNALELLKDNIKITIFNSHYYDPCDIHIRFLNTNEGYFGSWLKIAIENFPQRRPLKGCMDSLIEILHCFEENYDDIINIDFCRKCDLKLESDPMIGPETKQLLEKIHKNTIRSK